MTLVATAVGREVAEDETSAVLRTERSYRAKAILDWGQYEAESLPQRVVTWAEGVPSEDTERAQEIRDKLKLAGAVAGKEQERQRSFYRLGLELRNEEDPQRCPFCGEKTLTAERLANLTDTAEGTATEDERLPALKTAHAALSGTVRALCSDWTRVIRALPGVDDLPTLATILPREAGSQLSVFNASVESLSQRWCPVHS